MLVFDKWWSEMVQRNPKAMSGGTKITLTVEQLKANMRKAFDAGWSQRNSETPPKNSLDLIDRLFR